METLERPRTITVETETDCNVCRGSGELSNKNGDKVTCSWCGGTGKAGTDPRDLVMSPNLGSGHENITCSTCGQSMCPTCDASSHGPGKCG